jgi:hypothetical protein
MSAGAALIEAAVAALRELGGLSGVYEARPVQAVAPYATVEAGLELDWGHKSGIGRELRLTVTLHDLGEWPARLRGLGAEAVAAIEAMDAELDGWRLASLIFVRSMTVAHGTGRWTLTIEWRARMLAG